MWCLEDREGKRGGKGNWEIEGKRGGEGRRTKQITSSSASIPKSKNPTASVGPGAGVVPFLTSEPRAMTWYVLVNSKGKEEEPVPGG